MTPLTPDPPASPLSEEDFFDSLPPEEENIPFDLRRIDPILERKMTPDVRLRRGKLARVVVGIVGCGVLVLLAALAHVRIEREAGTASFDAPGAGAHASVAPAYRR